MPRSWEPTNLADEQYDRQTEPPAVCGLIYTGKRHALSGPPEAMKTLAALIIGLEHIRASGDRFALVDFEMGAHATRLLLADLGATLQEIAAVWYVAAEGPPTTEDLEEITEAGVTLAVIDSAAGAYAVSGLDDNKRQDAETFARAWIVPLWQRSITTLVLDHVVKNTEARGRYAIGSERKLGTVDVHLGFEPIEALSRGGTGIVRVSTHKDRPGHLRRPVAAQLHLNSDPDTHQIGWSFQQGSGETGGQSKDVWRPTVLMDRVLDYIAVNPEPISRTALAKAVRGKHEYKLLAIDQLVGDGRLTVDGKRIVPVPGNDPGTQLVGERSHVPFSTEGTDSRNGFQDAGEAETERLAATATDTLRDHT